jgi:8-oxo-dGTP pyrophosphatase MutT (NUDIX family)
MTERRQVALAILQRGDRLLLQLRDDIPSIIHPGVWGLFGGHLEPGESPEVGLRRELWEELSYRAATLHFWTCDRLPAVDRHVFYGPLTQPLEALHLQEGWDWALVSADQIEMGWCHSPKASYRPIALPHRRLLLNFLSQTS